MSATIVQDTDNGLEALSELIRSSQQAGVTRQALLLRTDRFPASMSRPERRRRARVALEPLTRDERSKWHDLPGGRIVLSWKGDQARLVGLAFDGLQRALSEHLLDTPSLTDIVDLYELPRNGEQLLSAATDGLAIDTDFAVMPDEGIAKPATSLQPLSVAELDLLEQRLAGTDISRFARRRPVSVFDGRIATLAWEERSLSIPELVEVVAPGRDARSDVWLFRRLTRVLDRRMLSVLSAASELRGAGPFSITLNVASVLSGEFLRFDAALPAALRGRVVISFLPADVAADAGAFAFARNFARARQYRVCLRAVSSLLLPALDLPALDLDFVQLIWSERFLSRDSLPNPGRARWIMGQPCTRTAANWGVAHGISLFTMKPTS